MNRDTFTPFEAATPGQSTVQTSIHSDDRMDICPEKTRTFYPHTEVPNFGDFFNGNIENLQHQDITTPLDNDFLDISGSPTYDDVEKSHIQGDENFNAISASTFPQPQPALQNNPFQYNRAAVAVAPVIHHAGGPSHMYLTSQPDDIFGNANNHLFPVKQECFPSFDIMHQPQPTYYSSPFVPQNAFPMQPPWHPISKEEQERILEAEILAQAVRLDIAMHTATPSLNYTPTKQWNHPISGFYGNYGLENAMMQFPVPVPPPPPPPYFRWPVPQPPMRHPCPCLAKAQMRVREWLNSIATVELDPVDEDDVDADEFVCGEDAEGEQNAEDEGEEDGDEDGDGDEEEVESEEEEEETDEDNSDFSFKTRSEVDVPPVKILRGKALIAPRPIPGYLTSSIDP